MLAFAQTSSLENCLEDSTRCHLPMIFRQASSFEWELSNRMVSQNTHKVDIYKSSDNLISCTPLIVCSMVFFWGNGIQGEPGYSPGGLPGGLS